MCFFRHSLRKQKYVFSYNSSCFFFLLKTLTFSCLISFFSSFMWLSQVFRLFCKKSFQLYPGSCRLSGDSHSISFQCYHHSSNSSFSLFQSLVFTLINVQFPFKAINFSLTVLRCHSFSLHFHNQ